MTLANLAPRQPKPPRILIYGPQKLGKSTFGSLAPNPIFIQTEDGLDALDVPAFSLAKTYGEVMNALAELATEEHQFQTVVIDSVDWLEPLIHKQVVAENPFTEKGAPVKNIDDIPYGKGFPKALDLWREYLSALNYLRDERGMMVIQIAHTETKKYDNPETDAYDRYQIKLHKGAAALLAEHSEMILFANYYVGTRKSDKGFNSSVTKAVGSGERILYTEERPAFIAGNRYGLPAEIQFDKNGNYWNVIAQHVPFLKQQAASAAEQSTDNAN